MDPEPVVFHTQFPILFRVTETVLYKLGTATEASLRQDGPKFGPVHVQEKVTSLVLNPFPDVKMLKEVPTPPKPLAT